MPPCVPGDDGARALLSAARCINQTAQQASYMQIWVRVPPRRPTRRRCAGGGGDDDDGDARMRPADAPSRGAAGRAAAHGRGAAGGVGRAALAGEHAPALVVALELPVDPPSDTASALARWDAEPVQVRGPPPTPPRDARAARASFPPSISSEEAAPLLPFCLPSARCVVLLTSAFLTNKKGFPVLSPRHQAAVKALVARHGAQVMVSGPPTGGPRDAGKGLKPYQQYVEHLYRQLPDPTEEQRFERPYLDYLQAPLQPLMDNLESQTYETFERDPVKYASARAARHLPLRLRARTSRN